MLRRFTLNDDTTKDSFELANNIIQPNSGLFMALLDIDSPFTNIPLDEIINICIKLLFTEDNIVSSWNKKRMFEMLSITLKESNFQLDNKYYDRVEGVAMDSPLGPTLANIFLCHLETIKLKRCPKKFGPKHCKRSMDDIMVLFEEPEIYTTLLHI